jgi:FKBP-type peptidyl-prolyl cis-trans isomerase
MKFSSFMAAVASLALLAPPSRAQEKPAPGAADSELKDSSQKASYGLGAKIGKSLIRSFPDLDADLFHQGLKDALGGKTQRMTDQQIDAAIQAYQQEFIAKKAKEGEAFLEKNKKKEGVVTLPSGLQYRVIKEGTGKTPGPTDTVTVNYEGRLIDRTVFDSSANSGKPATFQVGGVIKGFGEALMKMKAGSKWEIYIPANLAYAASPPAGSPILPNVPLVFDLELLEVK